MKRCILYFLVGVMLIAPVFAASSLCANPANIDKECQCNGFQYGVARWDCANGVWTRTKENVTGTSTAGSCARANWIMGSSGGSGVIIRSPNTNNVLFGQSGWVNKGSFAFDHITYCGGSTASASASIPEFTPWEGVGLLALCGLVFFMIRKR